MDNCGGQSYDGAGNMASRYAGALTLIQNQFAKIILFLDKFILVETSHTNSWIHPCVVRFLDRFRGHDVCLCWQQSQGSHVFWKTGTISIGNFQMYTHTMQDLSISIKKMFCGIVLLFSSLSPSDVNTLPQCTRSTVQGISKDPSETIRNFFGAETLFPFWREAGGSVHCERMKFESFRLVVRFYRASEVTYAFVAFVYIMQ